MPMEEHDKKISHTVYSIIEKGHGQKAFWMKVGIAYLNRDSSWNIYLDAMPYDRKLQIREDDPKFARGGSSERFSERNGANASQPAFDVGGIQ